MSASSLKNHTFEVIVVIIALVMMMALVGCSSSGSQSQPTSQASEGSHASGKADETIFHMDFPAEPEYKYSEEPGFPAETFIAQSDDCFVFVMVSRVNLDLEGEDPYDYAARHIYRTLKESFSLNISEPQIIKGTFDGCPAGYITLGSQDGTSYVFGLSTLGDDFVLDCFVQSKSKETVEEVGSSLSLR